jgi:hypothetical protein
VASLVLTGRTVACEAEQDGGLLLRGRLLICAA